jgi:vancomycin permeability regulator SanA
MKNFRFKKLTLMLFLIIIIIFIGITIYIVIDGLSDHIHKTDAMVVFGNQINPDGIPSPRLKARLDKAIQLFQQGYSPVIIISGGIEPNGFDEAAVMKAYLIQKGVPEDHIYSDNQGVDTYNSARNTTTLMQKNGWNSIMVVSQYFHITRAKLAFAQFGIPTIYSAHADYFELRDLYSLGREVIALLVYRVREYK